jgi:hypothetical protein
MLLPEKFVRLGGIISLMMILTACSYVPIKNPFRQKIPEATEVIPEALPPVQTSPSQLPPIQIPSQSPPGQQVVIHPTANEIRVIGEKIFANEAAQDKNNLVHWNEKEDFAAMGIAHFTWYPAGRLAKRGNTFPGAIEYLTEHGARPAGWVTLAVARGAPWYSREELERVKHTPQIQELINYLYRTRALQTEYVVERAKKALQQIVNSAPNQHKARVAGNINVLADTNGGWYPLVDYISFKGEGYNIGGGYKGQNWGMLQVLEQMQPSQPGPQALNAFADAANIVLTRRVQNSPPQKEEYRWLPGWMSRVNSYRNF